MTEHYENLVCYEVNYDGYMTAIFNKLLTDVPSTSWMLDDLWAYEIRARDLYYFSEHPNLYGMRHLYLEALNDKELQAFIDVADQLTALEVLVTSDDYQMDFAHLLTALPQLEALVVHGKHQITPVRHTQLKQLIGQRCHMAGILQTCSLPNLEVLEISGLEQRFLSAFNRSDFKKLRHFGLLDSLATNHFKLLKEMNMPTSLCSLALGDYIHDREFREHIMPVPWAKQLSHLTFKQADIEVESLSAEHFPALRYLKWLPKYEGVFPKFFFTQQLPHLHTLDMQYCNIGDDIAERLLHSPMLNQLQFLNLEHNAIRDTELRNAFADLNCQVSLNNQN